MNFIVLSFLREGEVKSDFVSARSIISLSRAPTSRMTDVQSSLVDGERFAQGLMYPLEWITTPVSSLSCKNPECGGLLANSLVPSTTQTGSAVVHQSVDHANERTNLTPLSLPLRHHRVLRPSATIRWPFAVRPLDR